MALGEVFLQCLVDEEADHGLRDAGVRGSQASVEAPNPFHFVNIAGTLQCIHLLLSSGSKRSNRFMLISAKITFGGGWKLKASSFFKCLAVLLDKSYQNWNLLILYLSK